MFGRKPPSADGDSPQPDAPAQPAILPRPPIPALGARPASIEKTDIGILPRSIAPPPGAPAAIEPIQRRPAEPVRPEPVKEVRKLIVGRDITLSGEIGACDHLIIEGTVDASVKDCHRLEVHEAGLFRGAVEIGEADIAGRFEGSINVQGRLMIRATGRISGKIQYGELSVEAGGTIDGEVRCKNTPKAAKPEKKAEAGGLNLAPEADAAV